MSLKPVTLWNTHWWQYHPMFYFPTHKSLKCFSSIFQGVVALLVFKNHKNHSFSRLHFTSQDQYNWLKNLSKKVRDQCNGLKKKKKKLGLRAKVILDASPIQIILPSQTHRRPRKTKRKYTESLKTHMKRNLEQRLPDFGMWLVLREYYQAIYFFYSSSRLQSHFVAMNCGVFWWWD